MKPDQYTLLLERLETIQNSLDRLDKDLASDREDIREYRIRISAVEAQVDEMRKLINTLAVKVGDKVVEAVQPMIDTTDNLNKTIKKKQVIKIRGESFWSKLIKR